MLERGKSGRIARHLQALSHQGVILHKLVQHISEPLHGLPARVPDFEWARRCSHSIAVPAAVARSNDPYKGRANLLDCAPP